MYAHAHWAPAHPLQVPDDFPYALLVLILVGMAGATAVLSALQTRGTVKAKWQ
jgi:hypothetical protein